MSKKPKKKSIDRLIANKKRHEESLSSEYITQGILGGSKKALSEGITLIESKKIAHKATAQKVLEACIPHSEKSIRIGITGVPGVGKSTFIESFGSHLVEIGKKVAVLAIDPSSERSGGSILGDKTRMETLSAHENAFIRPTASKGSLGGVAQRTRESILLCEAAGFDVILIETVGVGQSEIAVHSMTDFFLLLMLSGAGDELQGIKRGIMEMADTILITKADGDNVKKASFAKAQYKSAVHLFPPNPNGWVTRVETISALENKGIRNTWEIIEQFHKKVSSSGWLTKHRNEQQVYWMNESIKEKIFEEFNHTEGIKAKIEEMKRKIENGEITSYRASELIFEYYKKHGRENI